MAIRIALVISMLATVAPAAVKRDEFGGSQSSGSNSPVYSPSSQGGYSNPGSNSYSSNAYSSNTGSFGNSNQYSNDQTAAASSNTYQSQPSSPGNLYYYYYPVQDKPKETGYQASSSNQYTSAVQPNFNSAGSSSSESSPQHSIDSSGTGDLSYSAQDLSYTQALGQNLGEYGGQGNGYDQTMNNLASQLQQYGFSSNSNGNNFNPGSSNYGSSSGPNYDPTASAYGGASSGSNPASSSYQGTSEGAGSYPPGGQGPSYGGASSAYGPQGSQIPYGPQGGPYGGPYGGQHFGNYAAGSGPQASYEPATSGYRRYGIGSIIMPMLALAGLSLLIPTVTSLGTAAGRRRRSTENSAKETALTGYLDRIERYYSIYRTAVEREDCMNRIICELGDAVSNVRGKSTFFTVLEKVAPTWMGHKVGVFKNAALSGDVYGKCKKYTC